MSALYTGCAPNTVGTGTGASEPPNSPIVDRADCDPAAQPMQEMAGSSAKQNRTG
ncbi:MAG: hypothetical protein IPN48_10005 [Sphingomonadales bacterium]|nr:hypothetical protein [Sphingomonadales bacterium]